VKKGLTGGVGGSKKISRNLEKRERQTRKNLEGNVRIPRAHETEENAKRRGGKKGVRRRSRGTMFFGGLLSGPEMRLQVNWVSVGLTRGGGFLGGGVGTQRE